jgi:high-affinity iron transporter
MHRTLLGLISALLLIWPASGLLAQQQDSAPAMARRIIGTTALAAKEYAEGVSGGQIVAVDEVEEAKLFLAEARTSASRLPTELAASTTSAIDEMLDVVRSTGDPNRVTELADTVATRLRDALGGIDEPIPAVRVSFAAGADIYARDCAQCHGALGRGDGPLAPTYDPPPSDLTDPDLLVDQTPLDFFRKIGLGVSGTAMPAFEGPLSDDEIWQVAWYATQLRATDTAVRSGADLLAEHCDACARGTPDHAAVPTLARLPSALVDPQTIAERSDEELIAGLTAGQFPIAPPLSAADARDVVAYLRTLPYAEGAAPGASGAFARTRTELARAVRHAQAGDHGAAATSVFDAYVQFEGVETEIALRNNALTGDLETRFNTLRGRLERGDRIADVHGEYAALLGRLAQAETILTERPSATGMFVQSFVLLLREGVEAILIVAALITLVVRAGAPERKRDIAWGVGLAIAASIATAVLIETVFRIGVAEQEMLEGVTMLVAAGVLVFVGYWLLAKVEVTHWKAFVAEKVQRAISTGSVFTLGAAAFLAVYREGFETILFYKALFITSEGGHLGATVGGAILASVLLIGIYLAVTRFGLRIPLRWFFGVTSAVLLYMAFTFAGHGIVELQESQLIRITLIEWAPRVPWMGIYPTAQSLALQGALLALIAFGLVWTFLVQPRRLRVSGT